MKNKFNSPIYIAGVAVSLLLILLCPSMSRGDWSVLLFDDFDDGNYDGWSATHPETGDPVTPPDVVSSPEGYSLRGVGSGYSQDPGLNVWLTYPLQISNAGELKIEMRAKSGPQWPNSAWVYLISGADRYVFGDYGEGNQWAQFHSVINSQTHYYNHPINANVWHDFAWIRDAEGWWSLSIDGQVKAPNFHQDNRLTSFEPVGIQVLRNQSEIEWVRISGVPEPEPLTGRIAFMSPHPDEGGRLWVMDASVGLSSKVEVPLPQIFRVIGCPDWSRDDSWIAFHAAKIGENTSGIYVVKPDGSGFCKVNPDGINIGHPSFSPDGSQIVGCTASYRLYIFTKVGECDWQTEYLTQGVHPHWSPDGQKIAYSNWGLTYDSDIFVYDLETNSSTKITSHDPGKAFNHVIWSPDGTKLAVVELDRNTNKNNLCVMNADGSDQVNLTVDWAAYDELWPAWSPDGQYIVFSSDRSSNWDIWYTPPDHFAPINLTNSPEDEVMPAITIPETAEPEWSFVHMTDTHFGRFPGRPKISPFLALYKLRKMDPRPKFILVTGDIANFGCNMFSGCNILTTPYVWYQAMVNYAGMGDGGLDVYAVPGNHDRRKHPGWFEWFCDGELSCYNTYVNSSRPDGTTELDGSNNYYFNRNELMFIGLDSGRGFPTGEGLWESQINALQGLDTATPKVVFMHHPGVDIDDDGTGFFDEDVSIEQHKPEFLNWCESSNVELVLAGHSHQDHTYDRYGNELLPDSEERPLFIQTPSAGKQVPEFDLFQDDEGYRIINVQGGKIYPKDYTRITTIEDNIYRIVAMLFSPANLHVYDSAGRHLGILASGEAEWGIPDSVYISHYVVPTTDGNEASPETIIVFDPCDDYLYEVVGSGIGTYRLEISSTKDGNEVVFDANDIPTLPGSVHKYSIDWDVLSQGQNGVTVTVDIDGDGEPEKTIISDNELTSDEFDTPPIAKSGGPYMEQATSWLGAFVDLDGSSSFDPDGDALTYEWDLDLLVDSDGDGDPNNDVDAIGPNPNWLFTIGQTEISLVVIDEYGVRSEPDVTKVTVSIIEVGIDIKPGSFPNSINMGSSGVVPVAFLTDPGFDASTIDPATVTLRGEDFTDGLVKLRGKKDAPVPMSNLEDVDEDGDLDLVVHLVTEQLAEYELDAICELGALTYEGYVVSGSDTIRVVPE